MIDRDKFLKAVSERLDSIQDCVSKSHKDTSIEKVILYILDKYRSGKFEGIISIKINREQIFQPRLDSVVAPVETDYHFLDK